MWFTLSVGLSIQLAALERSPLRELVIDLFMSDLQIHGHRQQLLSDEGEKELIILSPNPDQANTCCIHFIASPK